MKSIIVLLVFLYSATAVGQDSQEEKEVLQFQEELNASFKDPRTTPLIAEDLKVFEALEFFPIDTNFRFVADFVRTPMETPFRMPTTTDRQPYYIKYGEAFFEWKGKEYKLNLYQNLELTTDPAYRDYLFMPFTDLTNGISTYSGGRYLDLKIPIASKIILNFNKAYNPYCAYNGTYSCPLPPEENHLTAEIKAGVKYPY